jgi:hypothetical protein
MQKPTSSSQALSSAVNSMRVMLVPTRLYDTYKNSCCRPEVEQETLERGAMRLLLGTVRVHSRSVVRSSRSMLVPDGSSPTQMDGSCRPEVKQQILEPGVMQRPLGTVQVHCLLLEHLAPRWQLVKYVCPANMCVPILLERGMTLISR